MSLTVNGGYPPLKKPAKKARFDKDLESSEIVITLNGGHTYTREDFVIDALKSSGEEGVYINELLRAWNEYRDKINKPRSNYAAFRKLVWSMKKKKIVERVPDYEKLDKDLRGKGRFLRSFYRLTARFLDSHI
jgi:hypothetical protein